MRRRTGFVSAALMLRRPALLSLAALALATACAGPSIPAPLDGLPVCPDFEAGHTKMEGSLRHPVRLRILDGKKQIGKIVILGLRKAGDPSPRTFIADDNDEYNLEWAQCSNVRAPRTAADAARETGKAKDRIPESDTVYECGEATVYKTDKLVTKKGDAASHVVKFIPPPDLTCWTGPPAPPPEPSAAPDAGAPAPAAVVDADAGSADAGSSDAGAAATGATDAGAAKK